jgi:hypothetical protein
MKRIFLFCFLFPSILFAEIQVVKRIKTKDTYVLGTVVDKKSGEFLVGAIIYLSDGQIATQADTYGHFQLNCPPKTFSCTIYVQLFGYFKDSMKINIDSATTTTLLCRLKNTFDSTDVLPAAGIIYGLCFTKNGEIDSLHSSFQSLDSIVAMMKKKPFKKICFVIGYRYEDGEFEPLNDDELFLRKYLVSKGISNDRLIFCNTFREPDPQPVPIKKISKFRLKHSPHLHKRKIKSSEKRKKKIDVYWNDETPNPYDVKVRY